jgi:Mg-chelatase subunit ChlD
MSLLRPVSLLLLVPLLLVVALLLRRGGALRQRFAPVWLFADEPGRAPARRRIHWRDPRAWLTLVAGVLWIGALAAPLRPSPALPSRAVVLLDAGTLEAPDATRRPVEETIAALAAAAAGVEIYCAGRSPTGPFPDLASARESSVDPAGPTLGELLCALAPDPLRAVEVFCWREPPATRGRWRAHRLAAPGGEAGPRLSLAHLDLAGRLCVAVEGAGPTTSVVAETAGASQEIPLDAQGRGAVEIDPALVPTPPSPPEPGADPGRRARRRITVELESRATRHGPLPHVLPGAAPLTQSSAERQVLELPAPPLVWLVSAAGSPWATAVEAWPAIDLRRVDRARLPPRPDAAEWARWRAQRGRTGSAQHELLVVVGDAPPAFPDSLCWEWIAPRAGAAPGLRLEELRSSRTGPQLDDGSGALEFAGPAAGLDLAGVSRACGVLDLGVQWAAMAGGRILLWESRAAVVNLPDPAAPDGSLGPALAALRVARALLPAQDVCAGPGLSSPRFNWPAALTRPGELPAAGSEPVSPGALAAAATGGRTGGAGTDLALSPWLAAAAWLVSAAALALARWPRRRRAGLGIALLALLALALRPSAGDCVLIVDASPSCRALAPAAAAAALREFLGAAGPGQRLAVAALDGEDGRWLLPPTPRRAWPFTPVELERWLQAGLRDLPTPPHTRLAAPLRRLMGATRLRAPRVLLVSDGRFEDTPQALAASLPVGECSIAAAPAGRSGDASVTQLRVEQQAAGAGRTLTLALDPGDAERRLAVTLDGRVLLDRDLAALVRDGVAQRDPQANGALVRLALPLPPLATGAHTITAELQPEAAGPRDVWPQDDILAYGWSTGPLPTVRWTAASGERTTSLPQPPAGGRPDVWVLDACPESLVAALQVQVLRAMDLGTGLLLLAGPGDWLQRGESGRLALEERLPVRLQVREERDPSRGDWVFLLDVSGSMATLEDGVSQLDRALLALSGALRAAEASERVGLVAFADRVLRTLPPQPRRTLTQVQEALRGVHASGGTVLRPALQEAAGLLQAAAAGDGSAGVAAKPPRARRIVVLSDGVTGDESLQSWLDAVGDLPVTAIEVGTRGTPALRELAARTGGRHLVLRRFQELGEVLARTVDSAPRDRFVAAPQPARAELAAWSALLPAGAVRYVALTPQLAQVAWSAGLQRDPLLALGSFGPGRMAVLASTAGPPWNPEDARWPAAVAQLLAWLTRQEQPRVRWEGGSAPRLRVESSTPPWSLVPANEPGLTTAGGLADGHASGLALVDALGDTVALEAVVPGVLRPVGPSLADPVRVIDSTGATGLDVAFADDPAAELRARGVDAVRLAALSAAGWGHAGAAQPAEGSLASRDPTRGTPLLAAALLWLLAGLAISRDAGSRHAPGSVPARARS